MATVSPAATRPQTRRRFIRKSLIALFWTLLLVVALRFFIKYAVHYFRLSENSYADFWPKRNWLLLHICGATLALFLGPLQFWSGARKKYLRAHRWSGRIYLFGVALGVTGAAYLAGHPSLGGAYGVALFGLATAWFVTSFMAYVAIRRGRVKAHKEWMIRSYVVTFAFIIVRVPDDIPILSNLGTANEIATTAVWLSWVLPLFVTEIILQWKHTVGNSDRKQVTYES